MSQFNETGYKSFPCGAAISQFRRVTLTAGQLQLAGATDRGLGTLRAASFAAGDPRSVSLRTKQGTAQYVASGAITAGADVFTDANGKISATQALGAYMIGTALEAAAVDGDVIEVLHGHGISVGLPGSFTFTPAAGAATVSLVTIQLQDAAGNNVAQVVNFDLWLSDSAVGAGLTATAASGAVAVGANGADLGDYTAKKAKRVQTDATGKYILSITDAAKTLFYVAAAVPNTAKTVVSARLTVPNYG